MASLRLACSASLRPGRLAIAAAPRQARHLHAAAVSLRAAAAPPPPPTLQAAARQRGGSSQAAPAAREAAHQKRLAETAEEVLDAIRQYSYSYAGRQAGFPQRRPAARAHAVASELLQAGMSRAGVVQLLQAQPGLMSVDPKKLAANVAAVRSLMRGVASKRVSLANKLGSAAGGAALAKCPPASFAASCELAADLAAEAAADAVASRAATLSCVLSLCTERSLAGLLGSGRDAVELRAVFTALQEQLGWSARQASAALLGLGVQAAPGGKQRLSSEGAPPLQLHRTSAQHVEQMAGLFRRYRLQGEELAAATYAARTDWVAIAPAEAEVALSVFERSLGQSGLPRRLAAALWLADGAGAADPAFLGTWAWLAHTGVPAPQLESLATALLSPGATPACFASSMQVLRQLLGSWPAAVEAAVADPSLLALTASLLPNTEAARAPSLPAPDIIALCEQLRAAASGQEQLLQLAKCVLMVSSCSVSPTQALGSLELLGALLGSPEAAVEAAQADGRLLQLPSCRRDMQTVFARLGAAGLSGKELVQMAGICARYSSQVDRLIWMADELYAGDWRAAMREFLRRWRVYVRCLCFLRRPLDFLDHVSLQVASDAGRRRVLDHIKVGSSHALKLAVQLPDSTPPEQRTAAALAALEQQGFRATGGRVLKHIQRLAPGDEVEIEIGQYNAQIKSLTCTELFSYSHVADAWRMETVEGC